MAARAEEWKQQWLLEGEQWGEAMLLLRLLERRFGVLPVSARDRVLAVDKVMIEDWGLRLLEATSLDQVLTWHSPRPECQHMHKQQQQRLKSLSLSRTPEERDA
jgi:hypothetical protein